MISGKVDRARFWDGLWNEYPDHLSGAYGYDLVDLQGSVLDVGCGDLRYFLIPHDIKFVGVDVSRNVLDMARLFHGHDVELVQADAIEGLPFPDCSFDDVISFDTLTLLGRDSYKAVKEMARVAKGRVIFTVTHRDIALAYRKDCGEEQEYGLVHKEDGMEKISFNEEGIERMVNDNGMKIEEMKVILENEMQNWRIPIYESPMPVPYGEVKSRVYVTAIKSS